MRNIALLKVGTSAAVLGLMTTQSCTKDKEAIRPKDLIIGDWKLIELDGESTIQESDEYVYFLTMDFMTGGGIELCYHYEYPMNPSDNNKYCSQQASTNWEWLSVEDALLKFNAEGESSTLKVDFPTNDIMNWGSTENDDYFDSLKFERVE